MNDPFLTRDLLRRGFDDADIARQVARGDIRRVRRGGYVTGPEVTSVEERHLLLLSTTLPQLGDGAVISHASAAVLHGLPVRNADLDRVHVTRDRSGGGQRRSIVHVHGAPVTEDDLTTVSGLTYTSVARTVIDLARSGPFDWAVAAADQALRSGASLQDLERAVQRARRWPGTRSARRVVAFANPLAESAAESISRVRCDEVGLPAPELQLEVHNRIGKWVGRCDFAWRKQRTLGEFDGRIKYGRLLRPGQRVEEVVWAEKRREDALRDLGWHVVRWTWDELAHFETVLERLRNAFVRYA